MNDKTYSENIMYKNGHRTIVWNVAFKKEGKKKKGKI